MRGTYRSGVPVSGEGFIDPYPLASARRGPQRKGFVVPLRAPVGSKQGACALPASGLGFARLMRLGGHLATIRGAADASHIEGWNEMCLTSLVTAVTPSSVCTKRTA